MYGGMHTPTLLLSPLYDVWESQGALPHACLPEHECSQCLNKAPSITLRWHDAESLKP